LFRCVIYIYSIVYVGLVFVVVWGVCIIYYDYLCLLVV